MYHYKFREREHLYVSLPHSKDILRQGYLRTDEVDDALTLAVDELIAKGVDAAQIGDQMYQIFQDALERKPSSDVMDPFGVYSRLLAMRDWEIAFLHNTFLARDECHIGGGIVIA